MLKIYYPDDMACKVTGKNPESKRRGDAWPKDPLVLHTQYAASYHRLEKAARRNPKAAEYLRNAPGPKWMRKVSAVKVGLVILLSAIGM